MVEGLSHEADNARQVLPAAVLELAYERGHLHDWGKYDPRQDLKRRTGVDLRWHNDSTDFGSDRFTGRVWGLTDFEELSVSLHVHLSEVQLRCVTAHECAHLDRGPVISTKTKREERAVELLAAQRLIDPIVFDALMEATDGEPSKHARYAVLDVDKSIFRSYHGWRSRVTTRTAIQRWEQAITPTLWPPRWMEQQAEDWPEAVAFAGLVR